MIYLWIVIFFICLTLSSLIYSKQQTTIALWYLMTSLVMLLFQSSDWIPVYIMRYFLYLMSAILIVVVPFILLALAILIVTKNKGNKSVRITHQFMSSCLILFCGYSLWNIVNIREVELPIMISLYSAIAIYFIALFFSYILMNQLLRMKGNKLKTSAILILGTEIDDEGQVQLDLRKRLDKALFFYQQLEINQQKETIFIVTGGNPTANGRTEAEGMERYLKSKGIASIQIVKEPSARNTEENFKYSMPFFKNIARKKTILVVSSSYHLLRSAYYARKYSLKVDFLGASTSFFSWPYATVREFIALLLVTKELNVLYIIFIIVSEFYKIYR